MRRAQAPGDRRPAGKGAGDAATRAGGVGILAGRCYPRLRALPPEQRAAALAEAQAGEFDVVEWIGMVGGTAAVTGLLRLGGEQLAAHPLPLVYFVQFVLALPALALAVGPFFVRRTRRGIERILARRDAGEP